MKYLVINKKDKVIYLQANAKLLMVLEKKENKEDTENDLMVIKFYNMNFSDTNFLEFCFFKYPKHINFEKISKKFDEIFYKNVILGKDKIYYLNDIIQKTLSLISN